MGGEDVCGESAAPVPKKWCPLGYCEVGVSVRVLLTSVVSTVGCGCTEGGWAQHAPGVLVTSAH